MAKIIDNEELMKEWDWEKNDSLGIFPNKVNVSDSIKAWWKCDKGHEWQMSCSERTRRPTNCPYCNNRKVVTGLNDLQTIYPDLAKEWHPTKNGDLKPSEVIYKSSLNVWWLCPKCGYEWQARINQRARYDHRGCRNCKSGLGTSFPEQAIYYYMKKAYPQTKSRYKDIFNNGSEIDIYIPELKVGIEYDGARFHDRSDPKVLEKEQRKYATCHENGIYLIRIVERPLEYPPNLTFTKSFDTALGFPKAKTRDEKLELLITFLFTNVLNPMGKFTLEEFLYPPVDINIERDRYDILSYVTDPIENSLQDLYPEIANEWHPTKNGKLLPTMVTPGSNLKVWWKCPFCGRDYQKTIGTKTASGRPGCKYCSMGMNGKDYSRKYIEKHGSFADNYPEIAKQWHPTKNGDLTPDKIGPTSIKKYWWLCPTCGHEWEASTESRAKEKGPGCPVCSGREPLVGVNDLATLYPELLKEWDYEKNAGINPSNLLPQSNKKVWWKCSVCGYEWQAFPGNRTKHNCGCPRCAGQVVTPGVNDLATIHPELLKEWDYSKNKDIKPTEVKAMSGLKVWWKCSVCGYEWRGSIANRSKGKGCDKCGHKRGGQKHSEEYHKKLETI